MKNKTNLNTRKRGRGATFNLYVLLILSLVGSSIVAVFTRKFVYSLLSFFAFFFLLIVYFVLRKKLRQAAEIKKMEDAFPDFVELMSSNLRAGMTIDRALLLSSRKEFAPLDKEILNVGKSIVAGKEISEALIEMADRIGSEKIRKTISLINSGIKAGGNLSVLLEQTAVHMRDRNFVEKRAASNVLMYVIFIFFAVAVGAPLLFGLSSVLVGVLSSLLKDIPTEQAAVNLPFTITKINISPDFVVYFAAIFIVVLDILASMILGLVGKGNEKDGLKYTLPLIAISLTVFFVSRAFLLNYFSTFFG